MDKSYINTIGKFIVAVLLFVAVFEMPSNYYTFLKVVIVLYSGWQIYSLSKSSEGQSIIYIFFVLLIGIFNSLWKITFFSHQPTKINWIVIDIFCGLLLIVSIFLYKNTSIFLFFGINSKEKINSITSITFSLILLLFSFYFIYLGLNKPVNDLLLINYGIETNAELINVKIDLTCSSSTDWSSRVPSEDAECEEYYAQEYQFQTLTNQYVKFKTGDNEEGMKITFDEFRKQFGEFYNPKKGEYPTIKVTYLKESPQINNHSDSLNLLVNSYSTKFWYFVEECLFKLTNLVGFLAIYFSIKKIRYEFRALKN